MIACNTYGYPFITFDTSDWTLIAGQGWPNHDGQNGGAEGRPGQYLGGAGGGQHRVGGRSRSPAVKRTSDQMNGGGGAVGPDGQYQYQQVPPRRQPRKVTYGTKNIGSTGAEAAPIEMFVGNTNPRATKEIVASVLKDCAKDMPEKPELEILDVRCLTNPERDPNPRTRSWVVRVPFCFKSLMENDEFYPAGWCHRKYFPARNQGSQNKRMHLDPNDPVNRMIDQQQSGSGHSSSS